MTKMDFLPMPWEAMFDPNLSLADLRVLGAIAYHDRRGANGRGCFATVATLAKLAQCDTRTVKRSLSDLRSMRYITSEQSKQDGRRLVHRVVYQSTLPEIGGSHAPDIDADRGHPVHRSGTSADVVSQHDQSLMTPKQRQKQKQYEADPENRRLSSRKAAQTPTSAGRRKHASNDAAWLRRVEDELPLIQADSHRMLEIYDDIDDLLGSADYGDPVWGWAKGIQERMQAPMDDLGCFTAPF